MTIEVLTLGFYENNPGEFWCNGDEQVVDTIEIKGDGFPFALSDREKLAGKALRLLGQRWDRRSCYMQINGCCDEIVVWKYNKEYKGDLPALALRLVKAEPKRQSTPQPCSYDCGDCAQCRAYGQWADEQE